MSVLYYAENWDGKFKKLTFELSSYAAKLADMLQTEAVAVSVGQVADEELQKLGNYGTQKIIAIERSELQQFDERNYALAISHIAQLQQARVVVLANNNKGKAIAPRLSVRLQAAIGSGVNQLPLGTDPFVISKRVFSGSAFARMTLNTEVKILTLAQNSFDLIENPVRAEVVKEPLAQTEFVKGFEVVELQKQTGKLLLSDAEVVISGGRGMKSPDNWAPLEELASLLDAATACSRPVSDEGWRPHEEHTGQTGKIIAPNLYMAIGISGATQHLAGISSSKYIVAVNTDKDAPIFEAAQYGIVGDAATILPKLVEAVKEIKS